MWFLRVIGRKSAKFLVEIAEQFPDKNIMCESKWQNIKMKFHSLVWGTKRYVRIHYLHLTKEKWLNLQIWMIMLKIDLSRRLKLEQNMTGRVLLHRMIGSQWSTKFGFFGSLNSNNNSTARFYLKKTGFCFKCIVNSFIFKYVFFTESIPRSSTFGCAIHSISSWRSILFVICKFLTNIGAVRKKYILINISFYRRSYTSIFQLFPKMSLELTSLISENTVKK